jgi:UDP-N-acetylmuramate dehydrogenase
VLDTGGWKGLSAADEAPPCLSFRSGTSVDEAVETAAEKGFSGLEFLAGMPGSIGGALWMNARCYGREIADVLAAAEIIDFSAGEPHIRQVPSGEGFSYKRSPFQGKDNFILTASFRLYPGESEKIRAEMRRNRQDRQDKGHYRYPCAGSAFKNNHDFGKPTGQIIDELGMRGLTLGGVQAAPFHGNIVINTGDAAASDIRALMDEIAARVQAQTGFILEPEILFVGEW